MTPILISACLLGQPVRYDSSHKQSHHPLLQQWQQQGRLISICPETAAGLPTPRAPAEIEQKQTGFQVLQRLARVIDQEHNDITSAFIHGANLALALAQRHQTPIAILKESSPSCGSGRIYDGSFSGQQHSGMGVTTALLQQHHIHVFNENQLDAVAALLQHYDAN